MKNLIIEFVKSMKNQKLLIWIFILIIMLLVIFYPIIDANFLYYRRINNRIDILDKVSNLNVDRIESSKSLSNEYESILKEISETEEKYLNNIFIKESSKIKKHIKFWAFSWMFIIVGVCLPFVKDKNGKRFSFNNCFSAVFCVIIGIVLGHLGVFIPTIINFVINVILYEIILVYLAYTLSKIPTKS